MGLYVITYIAVNANAHVRRTRPGMSDFLSVCVCAQWRDVIMTMTSVGQQQISVVCDVTAGYAGNAPVRASYIYTYNI